jgi:hypothetical protein
MKQRLTHFQNMRLALHSKSKLLANRA